MVMIKEAGIVREPRGISWQNWVASCKDAVVMNGKYLVVAVIVIAGVIGGALYMQNASRNDMAHGDSKPTTAGEQINLNAQPSTLAPANQSQSNGSGTAVSGSPSDPSAAATGAATNAVPVCDTTAQASAKLAYNTNLTLENTYHNSQLALLGVTGTVTSLLGSPNSAQVKAENDRHDKAVSNLTTKLDKQLAAAHCPVR